MEALWRAANSVDQFATTWAHWRELLGDDLSVFEHLLMVTNLHASHVPKPGCRHTWLRLVDVGQSKFAIDDATGETLQIDSRDSIVYQVNLRKVIKSTLESIGAEICTDCLPGHRAWSQVGNLRPRAGYSFPIYLVCGKLDDAVAYLTASTDQPFVLLDLGGVGPNTTSKTILKSRGAACLSLRHVCTMNDRGNVVIEDVGSCAINDFLATHLPTAATERLNDIFTTPASAVWARVHIRFVDGESIRIAVDGQSGTFHYSQLGMSNTRNAKPTKQWHLLRNYAANRGVITWRDSGAAANVKKQTQELSKKLIAFLKIDGSPIEFDKSMSGYRTAFQLEGDK